MMTVLPTPAPAEETDLSTFEEGLDQIDNLDAGLEHLFTRGLLFERRSRAVNRPSLLCVDRAQFIYWLANHVKDAAERRNAQPAP